MNLEETCISRREIFHGKVVQLHVDQVALPDGSTSYREIIDHPGGVGILALDDRNRVALVTQYRYAMGCTLREIPAGKREPNEPPEITARRELSEEVGAEAENWQFLGEVIPSPGCYAEKLYLYLARGLRFGAAHPDEGEFLEVEWVPFDELLAGCLDGTVRDGKTVVGVLKARVMGIA